jgi:transglutaminase-like putative cysteine protease
MYWWWNALLVYLAVLFGGSAVVLIGISISHPPSLGGIAVRAVWIVGGTVALRWYTWGVGSAVTVVGETLTWNAPRGARSVNIADLVGVRPYEFDVTGAMEVFELADGSRLPVMVRKGFEELVADLATRQPDLSVAFGAYSRACERLQRKSGFSRGSPR